MATGVKGGTGGSFASTFAIGQIVTDQLLADYNVTLNDLWQYKRGLYGGDFVLSDEFCGSAVDTGIWDTVGAGTTTAEGSGSAGFGVAQLAATAGNPNPQLRTRNLLVSTLKFHWSTLVRVPTINSGASIAFSLFDGATSFGGFFSSNAVFSGRWYTNNAGGADTDTGTSPSTTSFQLLEVVHDGATMKWYINGTLIRSLAYSGNVGFVKANIQVARSSADCTMEVDFYKLLVRRGLTGADGP